MSVIILVTPNCSGCVVVKKYLEEMKVKYETIDISKNPGILQKYPTMSVPTIIVNEKVEFIGTPNKEELKKIVFRGE
ncbi:MAG: glutaredoxin family protein [Candidatus Woesearchaeota archaeon]